MANIKCTFTSIWDDGSMITTPCEYDPKTGEVFPESVDVDPDGSLENEFITLPDGTEMNVCPECHEFVMHTVMYPDKYISHQLNEGQECKGPECENKCY